MPGRRFPLLLAAALAGLTALPAGGAPARRRDVPSIPAQFAQYLSPPGKGAKVKYPGRVFFDPVGKETLVADMGNNRVLVFDSNNVFRFQFYGNEHVTSIEDLSVTADGRIFVLGASAKGWQIAKFDYDGTYLASMNVPAIAGQPPADLSSMAAGADGSLFLLNDPAYEVEVVDTAGKLLRHFPVTGPAEPKDRKELIYGALSVHDSLLLVPMASFGKVALYTQDGRHLRDIGSKGGGSGELGFPVGAAFNSDGVLFVLDKNRFCVLCFGPDGKVLGEFGGSGGGPGWFYHPLRIAVNAKGQIVIAQNLGGSIQVCNPPAFLKPDSLAAKKPDGPVRVR